jgi:hypothetical protein
MRTHDALHPDFGGLPKHPSGRRTQAVHHCVNGRGGGLGKWARTAYHLIMPLPHAPRISSMMTFLTRAAALSATLVLAPLSAQAEVSPEVEALLEAMDMRGLMEVMHLEGQDYGRMLEDELFPGRGGPAWAAIVSKTYDPAMMHDRFAERFDAELDGADVAAMTEFFASDRGQRIVSYEITAREALLQEGIEEAAKETWRLRADEGDPRLDLVNEFIEANDLVESNVMGAMNANYAFYIGLLDGNAFPRQLSEEQVLADVWSQEDDIRDDTIEWVHSYLLMAYQPLSDEDLQVYTEMARTEVGRDLNRALFAAFDEVFVDIAGTLGLAAARFISGQDI